MLHFYVWRHFLSEGKLIRSLVVRIPGIIQRPIDRVDDDNVNFSSEDEQRKRSCLLPVVCAAELINVPNRSHHIESLVTHSTPVV